MSVCKITDNRNVNLAGKIADDIIQAAVGRSGVFAFAEFAENNSFDIFEIGIEPQLGQHQGYFVRFFHFVFDEDNRIADVRIVGRSVEVAQCA